MLRRVGAAYVDRVMPRLLSKPSWFLPSHSGRNGILLSQHGPIRQRSRVFSVRTAEEIEGQNLPSIHGESSDFGSHRCRRYFSDDSFHQGSARSLKWSNLP